MQVWRGCKPATGRASRSWKARAMVTSPPDPACCCCCSPSACSESGRERPCRAPAAQASGSLLLGQQHRGWEPPRTRGAFAGSPPSDSICLGAEGRACVLGPAQMRGSVSPPSTRHVALLPALEKVSFLLSPESGCPSCGTMAGLFQGSNLDTLPHIVLPELLH